MPVPQAVRGYIKLLPLAVVVVGALGLPAIARASDDSNKPTPKGQSLDGPLTPEGAAKSFRMRRTRIAGVRRRAKGTYCSVDRSSISDSSVEH
jgi:hypothetical protein